MWQLARRYVDNVGYFLYFSCALIKQVVGEREVIDYEGDMRIVISTKGD